MLTPEEKRRRHRRERILAVSLVLFLGAAVWALIRFSEREEQDILAQMYIPHPTTITPEVELLQQYIRIDTTNPPGNELPAAKWLAAILKGNGIASEIVEAAPGRASVYARIRGRRAGQGLLLVHHIDVVPATAEGWTRPPFAGDIHLNQLYGRGALDNKGLGICELAAFIAVARAGRQPERDIVFLAVADEETGSRYGTRWLLENRPDIIDGVGYAINEGGITEMMQEQVTYYGIEIGTKQVIRTTAHAATLQQMQKARIALEPWFIRREPDRVLPEVRRLFREIAPQRKEFRDELEDIDKTIEEGRFWILPIGYREVVQNNTWAEKITETASGVEMPVVLINLPDENPEARIGWLTQQLAPFGVSIGPVDEKIGPVPSSSPETSLYALLEREARAVFQAPVGTEFLGKSVSDSRFLRMKGIQAYGINAFPVDFFQSESIHAANERLRVDYFQKGVIFLQRVVNAWAFSDLTQIVNRAPQKTSV